MNTLFSDAIKLKDGVLYNLDYHQMRVNRTLQQFYGTTIDLSVLNEMIPEDKKAGFYKCRIIYSRQIDAVEFIPYNFRTIKKVRVVQDDQIEYSYKYADRNGLNELLEKSGCDDIIIVKNNLVTDSFSSNLVFQSASGLYTPDSCLLQGTRRQYLLDQNIIQKKKVNLEDIPQYDRLFFINAMVDLEDNISISIYKLIY